jgi:hypothetical protein
MHKSAITLIAIGTVFCATLTTPSAQVGVIDDTNRELAQTVSIGGQFNEIPSSVVDVLTVPDKKRFHLTDLILTNSQSSAPCDVSISGKTYEFRVGPSSTLVINMLTGPVFTPGQKLTLVNTWRLAGHGTSCRPIFTVMGYYSTRAP